MLWNTGRFKAFALQHLASEPYMQFEKQSSPFPIWIRTQEMFFPFSLSFPYIYVWGPLSSSEWVEDTPESGNASLHTMWEVPQQCPPHSRFLGNTEIIQAGISCKSGYNSPLKSNCFSLSLKKNSIFIWFFIFALQLRLFYAPVSIAMLPQEWNFLQASVPADWIFSYSIRRVHCLMNVCDLIFEQHVRDSYSLCMQILYLYERAIIFASWWITFKG